MQNYPIILTRLLVYLSKVEEESYFFRLSAYHDKLVKHIQDHPDFIQPSQYRNNIISRLESDNLRDLSISRTTFDWGINVPDGFDAKHVMYVWFDALTNYLTGVEGLDSSSTLASKFWPADVHIIGKDILWFHTVIWPCILMSANIPLPKTVFAHGFVNDKEGKKMSKSLGNVVDPHDMLDKFSVDTFRWYLCKEAPYGAELSFNEESLIDMHNSDLCDTLGNLIHRATNLCHKYCGGLIPDVPSPASIPINFDSILDTFIAKMANYELDGGVSTAIQGFRDVNGYLTEQAPWHMKGDELAHARQVVVRATLEAIYALSHLLIPFIPSAASIIFKKLNTEPTTLENLKVNGTNLRNLKEGVAVSIGDVLFTKVLTAQEKMSALEAAKAKAESYAEAQKRKKEKKLNAIASSKAGQISSNDDSESDQPEFTKIEIRVGKIVKVWNHPEADKLFCEEIDLGEESGPRQIASGLREHYKLEDMQDRKVLVVCNLKAAKIVGFSSNGMVLAAKSTDGKKVELVSPPADAPIGERVFIDGLSGEPHTSAQVKKKKIWENVAKSLKTVSGGVASWDGKVIQCATGPCTVASLVDAPIS
jgi:methionyl-tRNA synthetase